MDDPVQKIKDTIAIDELVSQYVKLEKAGSSLKGKCPFHNDKTPSFNVSPDRGFYKCFGCGESGDIFTFIQKIEGLEFKEALHKLGDKAGVEIKSYSGNSGIKKDDKANLYKILEDATLFMQKSLGDNEKAKDYLKKRGFTKDIVLKYRVGYVDGDFQSIKNYLEGKGYKESDIEKVGLIKKNEQGRVYDRFRERIMFPIFDLTGKVIAYSGRYVGTDDEKNAKYLNSPETPLFNKSKVLYGFNFAKEAIRKNNFVIVAEGQIDMVMSQSFGFPNTVVTSGTSLTDDHLLQLNRFTENIVFAFDDDDAGFNAAFKASKMALARDFNVKIAKMDEGKDPADMIFEDSASWKDTISHSNEVFEFFTNKIFDKKSNGEISEENMIKMIEEKVLVLIASLKNSIKKDIQVTKLAERLNVSKESVSEMLSVKEKEAENSNTYTQSIYSRPRIENTAEKGIIIDNKLNIVKNLTGIYFWQKSLPEEKRFIDPNSVLDTLKNKIDSNLYEKIQNLKNEDKINSLIFEVESVFETKTQLETSIEEALKNLDKFILNDEISELQKELEQAEKNSAEDSILNKLKEKIFKKLQQKQVIK